MRYARGNTEDILHQLSWTNALGEYHPFGTGRRVLLNWTFKPDATCIDQAQRAGCRKVFGVKHVRNLRPLSSSAWQTYCCFPTWNKYFHFLQGEFPLFYWDLLYMYRILFCNLHLFCIKQALCLKQLSWTAWVQFLQTVIILFGIITWKYFYFWCCHLLDISKNKHVFCI